MSRSFINFILPGKLNDLLQSSNGGYTVEKIIEPDQLLQHLKTTTKQQYRENGCKSILTTFDYYFSVLLQIKQIKDLAIYETFEQIHNALVDLSTFIRQKLTIIDEIDSNEKLEIIDILKMWIYLYSQFIIQRTDYINNQSQTKPKLATNTRTQTFDRLTVITTLNELFNQKLKLFWQPPVLEINLITHLIEIPIKFLQDTKIRTNEDLLNEIINIFGILITEHNYGSITIVRLVQLIKNHDHLIKCLPIVLNNMIDIYRCKTIIEKLLIELTEWQIDVNDNQTIDNQSVKNCGQFLIELAQIMPDKLASHMDYLMKYLCIDPVNLRIAILGVIVELIIASIKSESINPDIINYDECLEILLEHTRDRSSVVRSKIFQYFLRLRAENMIKADWQNRILEQIIRHLLDKGAIVRKQALACLTEFIVTNSYGAILSLKEKRLELEKVTESLKKTTESVEVYRLEYMEDAKKKWVEISDDLRNKAKDMDDDDFEKENQSKLDDIRETIKIYMENGSYDDAFKLSYNLIEDDIDDKSDKVDQQLEILEEIYLEMIKIRGQVFALAKMDEKVYENLGELELEQTRLKECVEFLEIIDQSMSIIYDMLETPNISDMHEAIIFLTNIYKFQMDSSQQGVLAMLAIMKRNEQERKDAITQAFIKIFLQTDCDSVMQHSMQVVERLCILYETIPTMMIPELDQIISDWTKHGILDNSIIDMFWNWISGRVKNEHSTSALLLLKMAARGRRTIATRNVQMVAALAFPNDNDDNVQSHSNDMKFKAACCEFMAFANLKRINETDLEPPKRLDINDQILENITQTIIQNFTKSHIKSLPLYIDKAIDAIYWLSAKPELTCEKMLISLNEHFNKTEYSKYEIINLLTILGKIAINQLAFLDDVVFKELKRRNYQEKQEKNLNNNKNNKNNKQTPVQMNRSQIIKSAQTNDTNDVSLMDGAQADDADADFILNVLEHNLVTDDGILSEFTKMLISICEQPFKWNDPEIQGAAIIALMRFMLISSRFCEMHIRLIFTIFHKTEYEHIQINILLHLSDLLVRFPNIIEPWTEKISDKLGSKSQILRRTTMFVLSKLILEDMMRVHKHAAQMAQLLVDDNRDISTMARVFFVQLSKKDMELYNVLPDIFEILSQSDKIVDDEKFETIMKFLIDLIDKPKQIDGVVERFLLKYDKINVNLIKSKRLTLCLSLFQHNERTLKKLLQYLPEYQHLLKDDEIYGYLKNILLTSGKMQIVKNDMKEIINKLDEAFKSIVDPNGEMNKVQNGRGSMVNGQSARTKRAVKSGNKKNMRKIRCVSDSSDSDE